MEEKKRLFTHVDSTDKVKKDDAALDCRRHFISSY